METMNYASKGVGVAGLTTGIIGAANTLAPGGLLSGLFGGGNCGCEKVHHNADSAGNVPRRRADRSFQRGRGNRHGRLRRRISQADARIRLQSQHPLCGGDYFYTVGCRNSASLY